MPELPEVETVRRQLAPVVERRTLERLDVLDARWCAPVPTAQLAAAVEGRAIARLGRRGKYLVWELAAAEADAPPAYLLMHLRMTGNLLLAEAPRLTAVPRKT